jgi:hypothetical protein
VPHCDTCDRFYNPNSLRPDGSCPTCGRQLGDPAEVAASPPGAPWHFKVLIAVTVVYLAWRFVQLVVWVVT